MAGILYGVGVGPGDPELMTLKAARILKNADVIGIPNKQKEKSVAYQIAHEAVPEIDHKQHLCMDLPMVKDRDQLEHSYNTAAKAVIEYLKAGQDLAFVTLGDSTIYATCSYVMEKVKAAGYTVCYISGIPSFCAVAASLNLPLVGRQQQLHIIPASYQIEESLQLPGVKILMKAGSNMQDVKKILAKTGQQVKMIERCGMPGEKQYHSVEEIPDEAGYYSLLVVW